MAARLGCFIRCGARWAVFFEQNLLANCVSTAVELLQQPGEAVPFRDQPDDEILRDSEAVEDPANDEFSCARVVAEDHRHDDKHRGGSLEVQDAESEKKLPPPSPD